MSHLRTSSLVALGLLAAAAPRVVTAQEVATEVMVRVLAHDAKLIGTSVGGARVTITNVATGEVLASGVTAGGTGDTQLIMKTPHERGAAIYNTEGAAGFRATFPLSRPTLVEVTAVGPLDYPQARASASKQLLLTPGATIDGNGLVLELHGLIVEILDEPVGTVDGGLAVRARVRMLCSCPTGPDQLWKVGRIEARLMDGGEVVTEGPLAYADETSTYSGILRPSRSGAFRLVVVAVDSSGANTGRVSKAVSVR